VSLARRIAVVGLGGALPGGGGLEGFWRLVESGRSAAREPPPDRWPLALDEAVQPGGPAPDAVLSRRACFVDDTPLAPDGLHVDVDLLDRLDPLVRLAVAAARDAWADAVTERLDPQRVGVIVGNIALPTSGSSRLAEDVLLRTVEERLLGRARPGTAQPLDRYVTGLPAGLIASALGLAGGAHALDAACASSLYALKLAADELLSGRLDAVVAGGLSRADAYYTQAGFSQLRALSPSGRCSPFDAKGDGLVVGEGAALFVLKRLDDALRDGDRVHGLLCGFGLANDVGGSLLVPESEGQLRALRPAYAQAGWRPSDVDLVECHATGTPTGDAVEVASLRALWADEGAAPGSCVIGSVKSNVGHLLTGAGGAGLMKVLLALRAGVLPPTAHFEEAGERTGLPGSPFEVLAAARPWLRRSEEAPRRAAVSAFGFGGINAHVLVEEWDPERAPERNPLVAVPAREKRPDVAVVGLAARFGPWCDTRAVRRRLLGEDDGVEPQPPTTWWGVEKADWLGSEAPAGHYLTTSRVRRDRFRIPPVELADSLPQQLELLDATADALEDAGLPEGDGPRLRTGVFVGLGLDLNTTGFHLRWVLPRLARQWAEQLGLELDEEQLGEWTQQLRDAISPPLTANRTMGALGGIVASRVAREFRVGGPSFVVSGEEASGLRALEVATRALQAREIDVALVGAVDLAGDPRAVIGADAHRPWSRSGRARPFDAGADGPVPGEGAAALVLERLDDALGAGRRVRAVVRGLGAAGGAGAAAVSSEVVAAAMSRALDDAGVAASSIGLLVGGAAGAPAEDAAEAEALAEVHSSAEARRALCVASAHADVGHSGAASGLASLVKAVHCLESEVLPALRGLEHPRAELAGPGRELLAPRRTQPWLRDRQDGPRRAGVTSFGVDGSCVHVVLEACERTSSASLQPVSDELPEGLLVATGEDRAGLAADLVRLADRADSDAASTAARLAARRARERPTSAGAPLACAIVARDAGGLARQARAAASAIREGASRLPNGLPEPARDRVFFASEPLGGEGRVAFVFPGSGNHFPGMGRRLALAFPEVLRLQDRENLRLASQLVPERTWNARTREELDRDHRAVIFGQVALGTGVSDVVRSLGVRPDATLGYSLGEAASLFAARAWTQRDEMLRRMERSTLFTDDLAGRCEAARRAWGLPDGADVDWRLGVVARPAAVVRDALAARERCYLLIVNAPDECVVGGDREAVEALVRDLRCTLLPLSGVTTVHCEVADPVARAYRDLHLFDVTPPDGLRIYSPAWARAYEPTRERCADSILEQAASGFDFPALVERAWEDGLRIFLEMGPGGSCTRMISRILGERPHVARAACPSGGDELSALLRLLGACAAERLEVDLRRLHPEPPAAFEAPDPADCVVVPIGAAAPDLPEPPRPRPKAVAAEPAPPAAGPPAAPVGVATVPPDGRTAETTARPLLAAAREAATARAEAHGAWLDFQARATRALSEQVSFQLGLIERLAGRGGGPGVLAPPPAAPPEIPATPVAAPTVIPAEPPRSLTREQCLEFAVGRLGPVLGRDFAHVDDHPTRVRLPDEPLMLVDRILAIEGEPNSMTRGRVVTEHDVQPGAWYLDQDRIPTCIAVEAGQADLFLSGFLGIDSMTKGLSCYRLLDARVTFHGPLPRPGATIRYDIHVDGFFRQGDTWLFRFHFDGTVDGEKLITMRDGCAGFFSEAELAAGRGIVHSRLDLRPDPRALPADWVELAPPPTGVEAYSDEQLDALRAGDLAACFGPDFAGLPLSAPVTLPGGRMRLVHRVTELDPTGGRHGLGRLRAEADVRPDDWYLTCHFSDDMVMPGTLMYECCLHALRVHVMRLGWVGERGECWWEPVLERPGQLKCRGQVLPTTKLVTYEVSIKEIGYGPEPFVVCDALMLADGKPIVEITDMSLRMGGMTRERLEATWSGRAAERTPAEAGPGPEPALYDTDRITAFAVGRPSDAFGEPYRVFDEQRRIARLPGPPFQFLDRVTRVEGEPFVLRAGASCRTQYAVPPGEWYLEDSRGSGMPFAVLLEIALQPCGWLAAYCGSALTSEKDLSFRNLGGRAVQHRAVGDDAGLLTVDATMTRVSQSGGMIIQHFDYLVSDRLGRVYEGDTYFGFFTAEALANQVGIRDAKPFEPDAEALARARSLPFPREAPFPGERMRMVDRITVLDPSGGPAGLGFVRGELDVDPSAWYFAAHFFQDPVIPGSLGLESVLQLVEVLAAGRWGTPARFQCVVPGVEPRWTYRGQVIPRDARVAVQASVTAVDEPSRTLTVEGWLSVDGRLIYRLEDFTVGRVGS
jgi:acyl transferase domain-containing protein/3-hydroxymyristoyl/3-hydroxydecanoyl-(acyl carrier protein) dehydratase